MQCSHTIPPNSVSALLIAVAAFICAPLLVTAETETEQSNTPGFELSAEQGMISLKATNASLKTILDRIGQELSIKVDAQVVEEDTVTDESQSLSPDEALKRLAPNSVIISHKSDKRSTKIRIPP